MLSDIACFGILNIIAYFSLRHLKTEYLPKSFFYKFTIWFHILLPIIFIIFSIINGDNYKFMLFTLISGILPHVFFIIKLRTNHGL